MAFAETVQATTITSAASVCGDPIVINRIIGSDLIEASFRA